MSIVRLAQSGIDTSNAAENLGGGYMSLAGAFAGWRELPAHDANLLMPEGARFGVAIAKYPGTQYDVYWGMEIAAEPAPPTPHTEGTFMSLSGGATQPR